MRDRRLPFFVLLASACVFLASLYLRWVGTTPTGSVSPVQNLFPGTFPGSVSFRGWAGPHGSAAALAALAVAFGAAVSVLRPQRKRPLSLASAGLLLLYLALLNAAFLQGTAVFEGTFQRLSIHLAPGAYLGIASAAVAFLTAVAASWEQLARRPSVPEVVAFALTAGLLAAFILPWLHVQAPQLRTLGASGFQLSNLGSGMVFFIAGLACLGLPLWTRARPPRRRLLAALGIVLLVAGELSTLGTHVHWPYEAWLQLGCALGLVALALATSRGLRLALPPLGEATAVGAAALLVVSMFLPWERISDPGGGAHASYSGWAGAQSSTAGEIVVVLLVLLLGFRQLFVELAVGTAIYVMASGFANTQFPETHLGSGAPLGFAGAALLLVAAARRLGSPPHDRKRLLVRLVPIAACLAFLAIPVSTLTERLSIRLEADSPWRWYWLEVGVILVALRLFWRWLSGPRADDELVLLSHLLLALTVLDVAEIQSAFGTISWEGWASIGLCLLLAVLGWLERTGGLGRLRLPEEIWRVDRLPGES